MQFFTDNILLIIIFPLISAIIAFSAHILKFAISEKTVSYCSIISSIIGLIFAVALYYNFGIMNTEPIETFFNWLKIGDLNLSIGIIFDNVSTLFLLILMLINFIVQLYSSEYLENDKNYNSYFGLLNLFVLSSVGLALSTNLPQTYIFLELVGVFSYILINHNFEKTNVSEAAKKVFIINRIGDMMMLAGIIILIYFSVNYPVENSQTLLGYSDLPISASDFYVYLSDSYFYVVCLLLFGGAIVKSAQFPMHVWIVEAAEAPIPVSVLIHSAVTLTAGVFLTIRLLPLFELSPYVLTSIIYLGLTTAVLSGFFAIGQTDIKKMFAYSTSSQFGLILATVAVLSKNTAMFYMTLYSFSIALLLLIIGIFNFLFNPASSKAEETAVNRKQYPVLFVCYLIAVFSITETLFSGFYSKDVIFDKITTINQPSVLIMFASAVLMTGYYLFKSYYTIFEADNNKEKSAKTPLIFNMCIIFCTIAVICAMLIKTCYLNEIQTNACAARAFGVIPFSILSTIAVGIFACYIAKNKKLPLPSLINKLSLNGAYISNIYDKIADNIIDIFRNFTKITDKYIIDAFVNLQAYSARLLSWCITVGQSGNIQTYIAFAIIMICVFFTLYILLILGLGVE